MQCEILDQTLKQKKDINGKLAWKIEHGLYYFIV